MKPASGRQATLTQFDAPRKVAAVNLMEENDAATSKKTARDGNKLSFPVAPFDIVTMKIKLPA